MLIEKRNIDFDGQYAWYIDDKETKLSEPEIIKLVGKENEKKFFSLWDYYGSFKIEV